MSARTQKTLAHNTDFDDQYIDYILKQVEQSEKLWEKERMREYENDVRWIHNELYDASTLTV